MPVLVDVAELGRRLIGGPGAADWRSNTKTSHAHATLLLNREGSRSLGVADAICQ
jgi:hypothetical protein